MFPLVSPGNLDRAGGVRKQVRFSLNFSALKASFFVGNSSASFMAKAPQRSALSSPRCLHCQMLNPFQLDILYCCLCCSLSFCFLYFCHPFFLRMSVLCCRLYVVVCLFVVCPCFVVVLSSVCSFAGLISDSRFFPL